MAIQINKTPQSIGEIVRSRQTLEELKDSSMKWKNLNLNDKLKFIHFVRVHNKLRKLVVYVKLIPEQYFDGGKTVMR